MKHRVKGSSFFQSSRVKKNIHAGKTFLYSDITWKLMLITNSENGVKQDMSQIMDWYNFGTHRLGRVHRFHEVINATIRHSTFAFQGGSVGEQLIHVTMCLAGVRILDGKISRLNFSGSLIPRRNTQHFLNRTFSSPEVFENEVVNRKCQAAISFSVKSCQQFLLENLVMRRMSEKSRATPLFGLHGYVPLDRVWFFSLAILNRV